MGEESVLLTALQWLVKFLFLLVCLLFSLFVFVVGFFWLWACSVGLYVVQDLNCVFLDLVLLSYGRCRFLFCAVRVVSDVVDCIVNLGGIYGFFYWMCSFILFSFASRSSSHNNIAQATSHCIRWCLQSSGQFEETFSNCSELVLPASDICFHIPPQQLPHSWFLFFLGHVVW